MRSAFYSDAAIVDDDKVSERGLKWSAKAHSVTGGLLQKVVHYHRSRMEQPAINSVLLLLSVRGLFPKLFCYRCPVGCCVGTFSRKDGDVFRMLEVS
jgi:hypothetical protein